jgi:hypothetical protein
VAAFSPARGGATSTQRVLLGLILMGHESEAEHAREPSDRLVIVAVDEGDVGEGSGHTA